MPSVSSWLLAALDILIVAFVFYKLLALAKGTRGAQMFLGFLLIIGASIAAESLQLVELNWIISSLKTVWVVAFVILFQPELRRALAQLGQNRFMRFFIRFTEPGAIGEVVKATSDMSGTQTGALIVMARNASLRNYVETGTRIEGKITAELLGTIFTPRSPLHDGAVIVHGDQIVAAGCILPLSQNPHLAQTLGTRHRAALGLTEEADAVVIVVSEETGVMSLASKGRLRRNIDANTLRKELAQIFSAQ
ncbi:MAG: diadenylate cyclase CdaA [Candidatus Eisenbacteria sp.]|nr:diadenylate cyclase CdaA [Candidatus Eisenbacteria bacterium]